MAITKYIAISFKSTAFHCPNCGVLSRQHWKNFYAAESGTSSFSQFFRRLDSSWCEHCEECTLWIDQRMLFPSSGNAPLPHPDMPADIAADFQEARNVVASSPRSAAALLRLAIQKLCIHLGEPGININADIASLVAKGLPVMIQQALDIVRVVGNEQVHPGELDVRDNPEIALHLFDLVNHIVEERISRPAQIEALYLKLPQSKRDAIDKRDA